MTVTVRPSDPRGAARKAAVRLLESVFEVSGESMSPTIERGWRVLVAPMEGPPEPGMVVLIDIAGRPLIHRLLGFVTWGCPPQRHAVHAGDSSALPGIVPASCVRGRVCAVVLPSGRRLPSSNELPQRIRVRHSRFLVRCNIFAILRRSAEAVPRPSQLPLGVLARVCRGLLGIG